MRQWHLWRPMSFHIELPLCCAPVVHLSPRQLQGWMKPRSESRNKPCPSRPLEKVLVDGLQDFVLLWWSEKKVEVRTRSCLPCNQAHSWVTIEIMKPLHASHHKQSKSSVGVVQNYHFYSFLHHGFKKKVTLADKKQLSSLSHFSLINLKATSNYYS